MLCHSSCSHGSCLGKKFYWAASKHELGPDQGPFAELDYISLRCSGAGARCQQGRCCGSSGKEMLLCRRPEGCPQAAMPRTHTEGRRQNRGREAATAVPQFRVACYFFILQKNGKDNEMASFQLLTWHTHSRQLSFTTITCGWGISPLCWGSQARGSLKTASKCSTSL